MKDKQDDDDDAAARQVSAVMIAAGRSPRVAGHLPAEYQKQLAALCVEGKMTENVRDKVITILRAAGEENKANIDEDEGENLGGKLVESIAKLKRSKKGDE